MHIMVGVSIYILKTGYYRFFEFFRHWYIEGARRWYAGFLFILSRGEKVFALRANLFFLFSPLYQERNVIGFLLGFFVRLIRIIGGGLYYILSALFFIGTYILWAALPLVCIYKGITLLL